jgi:hypothetical protein
LMLSPRVIAPSTTLARSSQESPMSPFINKRDHGMFKPFTRISDSMQSDPKNFQYQQYV